MIVQGPEIQNVLDGKLSCRAIHIGDFFVNLVSVIITSTG